MTNQCRSAGIFLPPSASSFRPTQLSATVRTSVTHFSRLGFIHLHHLTPKPAGYPPEFLYPDFVSVVFMSEAGVADPMAKLADDYEQEAVFRTVAKARELGLSYHMLCFLDGALRIRAA